GPHGALGRRFPRPEARGAHQTVRRHGRGRRPHPRGASRGALRPAGAERRGQDDDAAHGRRPAQARRRRRLRAGQERPARAGRGQAPPGVPPRRSAPLRQAEPARVPRVRGRPLGRPGGGGPGTRRGAAQVAGALGAQARPHRDVLARHEAEARPRRRADPRAGADHPRRAAHRARRGGGEGREGPARRARARRPDRDPDDAHHGGRRAPGRAHRHHQPGPPRGRGHPRRAAGPHGEPVGDARGRVPRAGRGAVRPGSLPWLLRHELRVRWREALGDTKPGTALFLGAMVLVAAHLFLAPLAEPLAGIVASPRSLPATLLAGVALLVLVPMGLTVGINHSVMALFERGDLDLLASSPLRARTVFASRLLAVAAAVFLPRGVFVLPLVTLGLYVGAPRLLGAVPLLASVALTTASLGMLLTLALVRALGPRRARTLSQVLAALAGAFLFLLTQLPNLMRGRT